MYFMSTELEAVSLESYSLSGKQRGCFYITEPEPAFEPITTEMLKEDKKMAALQEKHEKELEKLEKKRAKIQ